MRLEIRPEIRIPTINMDRATQWSSTLAILVCVFCIAVEAPNAPPWLRWAWKGIVAGAAYYKGLHTDKPEKIP